LRNEPHPHSLSKGEGGAGEFCDRSSVLLNRESIFCSNYSVVELEHSKVWIFDVVPFLLLWRRNKKVEVKAINNTT